MSIAPGPELLGQLLNRHGAALALYARQWCSSPEDVVQEAFLRLAAQPVSPHDPAAWLFHVVRNGAISAGRSETRRRKHESLAAKADCGWFETADVPIDSQSLGAAIEELLADERELVVLHVWGKLTFAQIAELTGESASTVHRRYHAALAELKNQLLKLAKEVIDMAEEFSEKLPDELQPFELKQFETLLRSCPPAAIQIDRDRLMYSAGQASANGDVIPPTKTHPSATGVASYKRFTWPLATAALLLLSLTLSAAILFRPSEVRIVYVTQPSSGGSTEFVAVPATENLQPAVANDVPNYLHVRNLVLERGVEALPEPTVAVSNKSKKPSETDFVSPLLRHNF